MLDLTDTVIPKSDQLNGDDLISGPRTFTVTEVRKINSDEQPVAIHLAEFPHGRPFKPSKTVRRILIAAWGPDASVYAGRRMTLFRDNAVRFGGEIVGGIRVSHLSHIERRFAIPLNEKRGKKAMHVIEPLPDDAPTSPPIDEQTVARIADLRAEWLTADDERKKTIEAEVQALQGAGS